MQDSEREFLWNFYQDQVTYGRHYESLRATTTSVLLAVAAGVLSLLGSAHAWLRPREYLSMTVLLIGLGVFGAFFSAKYDERFLFHMNRAREYRKALESDIPGLDGDAKRAAADNTTRRDHPWLYERRLYRFWVWVHLLVATIGTILTVTAVLASDAGHS